MNPLPRAHPLLGPFISPSVKGNKLPKNFVFADSVRRGSGLGFVPPPIKSIFFKKGELDPLAPFGLIDAYYGGQLRALEEDGFIVIALNPFKPLDPQIKAAKARFISARERMEENDKKLLESSGSKATIKLKDPIKLLRAIDAHNECITFKDIGMQIYNVSSEDYSDAAATGHQHVQRALNYWKYL